MAPVRATVPYLDYGFYHRSRGVASSSVMLPVVAIYLYDLREVCLSREHILDTATVEHKVVSRKLEAVLFCHALPQIG